MRGVCNCVRMERISNNAFGLTEVDAMEMMEAERLVGVEGQSEDVRSFVVGSVLFSFI